MQTRNTNLPDVYHDYAITLGFSKGCGGDYDKPYCFEEGNAYRNAYGDTIDVDGTIKSATSGEYRGRIREGYAINYVELPKGKAYDVTLTNSARAGTIRASLVCDTGDTLEVSPFLDEKVPYGSTSVFQNYNARDCERVLAVITSYPEGNACTQRAYRVNLSAATTTSASVPPTATPRTRTSATATPIAKVASGGRVPSQRTDGSTGSTSTGSASSASDAEEETSDSDIDVSCVPAMGVLFLMGGIMVTGARRRTLRRK